MIPLNEKSIDFLGIRHGWTLLDLYVQKNELLRYVIVPDKKTLKGWSVEDVIRESDVAILAAQSTANAVFNAYSKELISGERKLISVASESARTTEHQQIIWYILSQLIGDFEHWTSPLFRERFFGNIQGFEVSNLENQVLVTPDDSGVVYPNIRQALTYATNFKWLEKACGVKENGGEEFQDYVKRTSDGVREFVNNISKKKKQYIFLMILHQISGIPILRSFRWLNKEPAQVHDQIKYADTQDKKEDLFDYFHIDPARLQRVRLYANGRFWFEEHENNDAQHLAVFLENIKNDIRDQGRLEGEPGKVAAHIRDQIAPWYVKKGWAVDPYREPQPFNMRSHPCEGAVIEIESPIVLADILLEPGKIPDTYVSYHLHDMERVPDIPNWMKEMFRYNQLSNDFRNLSAKLANQQAPITLIRQELSNLIKDYASKIQ